MMLPKSVHYRTDRRIGRGFFKRKFMAKSGCGLSAALVKNPDIF